MFISFPAIVSQWVELSSLASSLRNALMSKVCAFVSNEGSHHKGLTSSLAQSIYINLSTINSNTFLL